MSMIDRPPLPRPDPSPVTPHRVEFSLSDGEFACLSAIADHWGSTPGQTACTLLCLALEKRWETSARRSAP
jgi:hypothetical protein